MRVRHLVSITALVVAGLLAGCVSGGGIDPAPEPIETPGGPASGTRLAPGLYDQEDGTALAIGTLEWNDLEGGFWAVTGGTESEGNVGEIVAVIANGSEFESELKPLENGSVSVAGMRLDGASIRMAGPEIQMTSVEEISDTPGPAE